MNGVAFAAEVDGASPPVVRLQGELDLAGVPLLRSLLEGLDGDVELDCSGLGFIDAAGAGVFMRAHRECAERGHRLVVVDPSPAVVRLLGLLELDAVLHIRRTGVAS